MHSFFISLWLCMHAYTSINTRTPSPPASPPCPPVEDELEEEIEEEWEKREHSRGRGEGARSRNLRSGQGRHFSYFAFEGGLGSERWKHEAEDFHRDLGGAAEKLM